MTAPTPDLLPCPWCGGAPKIHREPLCDDVWVQCYQCEAEGPYANDRSEAGVVELWNRRASHPGAAEGKRPAAWMGYSATDETQRVVVLDDEPRSDACAPWTPLYAPRWDQGDGTDHLTWAICYSCQLETIEHKEPKDGGYSCMNCGIKWVPDKPAKHAALVAEIEELLENTKRLRQGQWSDQAEDVLSRCREALG